MATQRTTSSIEALEASTLDGVLTCRWVTLPLKRMEILFWLGYCCRIADAIGLGLENIGMNMGSALLLTAVVGSVGTTASADAARIRHHPNATAQIASEASGAVQYLLTARAAVGSGRYGQSIEALSRAETRLLNDAAVLQDSAPPSWGRRSRMWQPLVRTPLERSVFRPLGNQRRAPGPTATAADLCCRHSVDLAPSTSSRQPHPRLFDHRPLWRRLQPCFIASIPAIGSCKDHEASGSSRNPSRSRYRCCLSCPRGRCGMVTNG